ncbi:MAG: hypothetical protein H6Q90_5766 [Deltaproteobacteria bacterium]|nr:hypothetical protein [Deltaproteobacteria bacterium]
MTRSFLFLSCITFAACSGDDGGATIDSGTAIDAPAGGCQAICNTLTLPAVVTKTANPAPRPAFTGGAITDGTYGVTAIVTYGTTTPGGVTVQETYKFAGGSIETAIDSSEAAEMRFCGTYTTAANMVTFNVTCPLTRSISLEYTATSTTFAFQHGSDQNEVATAVRQ